MIAILPFLGDKVVPGPLKILLGLLLSALIYPVLVSNGSIRPAAALVWGQSAFGIVATVGIEVMLALAIGFSARIIFDAIQVGGDIAGNFMGFGSASQFDPHQESQTQVISKFQMALGMLIFLGINGHHMMLQGALESFRVIGIGQASISGAFAERLVELSTMVIRVGMQLAAPMAISFFGIHVVYGIMAKALPQMNILILSFSVSAFVGLFVLLITIPEFHDVTSVFLGTMGDQMLETLASLRGS